MYNRKRKFQIQNETINEIKQPYNYVGLKGKTLKDIVLYSEKDGNEVAAKLQAGYEIEILLAESSTKDYEIDHLFLVKTDFGLVGWLRLADEDTYGAILKELYFAGD